MFFWKKKEKTKPTPYEADIEIKKDRIVYGLRYWAQADPLQDFLNIAEEVVREFLEGYILYIVKYELKPEKMEGVLKYIQSFSDADYVYCEDRIIEKQKRFKSYLFDYYYKKENGEEVEHDFRNFYIYAYKNDIEIECDVRKRERFMLDTADIIVSYEELCEGPTIEIESKNEVYDFEKYMRLCINTLKKYGKNTKFQYIDETIDEN